MATQISLVEKISTPAPLVIGVAKDDTGSLVLVTPLKGLDSKNLLQTLNSFKATGKSDEVTFVPDATHGILVFTGMGKFEKKFSAETLRRAAGSAARSLHAHAHAAFALPASNADDLQAIAEGALLGSYAFHDFRGSGSKDLKSPLTKIEIYTPKSPTKEFKDAIKNAHVIVTQVNFTRNLINMPPSYLTPDRFTKLAKAQAPANVKIEIMNEVALKRGGYGGITAVGQGSANPPRLVRATYRPARAKAHLAFVGKGITFDTGGLALKPAQGMEAMKSDMSGAAAVMGAIFAIAELKLPISIDAWAPLAENMVSDTATRPSDVITMYGGKTVEVLNPDAEGRLVLGDVLVRAAEVAPKLNGIIDVATLTGAQIVALGTKTAAVMTNDFEFSGKFLSAANAAGEQFWPMPLPPELRASLDSPVADLANIGERMGGMLVAGLFLQEFVAPNLPWLHLDIAGPSYNEGAAHGYTPVGGVGFALRSLVRLAQITK